MDQNKDFLTSIPENHRRINRDTGDTDPFLNYLQPNNKVRPTGDVHATLSGSRNHGPIICRAVLLNKLDLVIEGFHNLVVLVSGLLTVVSAKASENPFGLGMSAIFDQPTRRLGEEPDYQQQHNERQDLERDREPPADLCVSVIDE
jgi:hypothetical protein